MLFQVCKLTKFYLIQFTRQNLVCHTGGSTQRQAVTDVLHLGKAITRKECFYTWIFFSLTVLKNLFSDMYTLIYLCIYLFLDVLGLRCSMWAISSCREWGLLSSCDAQASHCSGFSLQWLLLWSTGSRRVSFSSCNMQA